jgi:tRNA (uracil-5-)-methyltransferase TRM9
LNDDTARTLNVLNRAFYATIADDFDATRAHPWPGWARLLPLLPASPLRVLDVGCGNGRFGVFLASHFPSVEYHGIDNSPSLLERARTALDSLPNLSATLETHDVVDALIETPHRPALSPIAREGGLGNEGYDLVALFGVLHHIPGAARRVELLRALAGQVKARGLLVFACWRFYEFPRFRDRIIPFPTHLDVEPGDYLLDWRRGAQAVRYCHYVDDAEQAELTNVTGLTLLDSYRADGESGNMNAYVALRR